MFLFNPLISPRSYVVSFYVNSSKETAVLHQEDEPGDLPITLTVLGVTVTYLGLSCAWFSPGESQDFSNESLVNSSVPRRPPQGFVTSYCPTLGRTA